MRRHKKPFLSAFTLVELLVVVAILAMILTLAGPAMNVILNASKGDSAAEELSLATEWARAEAVAQSTFVWMRLGEPTAARQSGSSEPSDLELRIWSSRDGSSDGSPANLVELRRAQRWQSLSLAPIAASLVERPDVPQESQVDGSVWLIFSPDGSAREIPAQAGSAPPQASAPEPDPGLERWIELGLQPTKGGTVTPGLKNKGVVLQIAGLTGQAAIYR